MTFSSTARRRCGSIRSTPPHAIFWACGSTKSPGSLGRRAGWRRPFSRRRPRCAALCPNFALQRTLHCAPSAGLFGWPINPAPCRCAQGTFEEAYEHFHAAEELSPGFYLKNRLRLAQCCIARKVWLRCAGQQPLLCTGHGAPNDALTRARAHSLGAQDKKTAKSWLEKAVAMHAVSTEDEESLAEAKKLLSSL